MATTLKQAKQQLRQLIQQRLLQYGQEQLQTESQQVISQLVQQPAYQKAQHISIYINMEKGELQTNMLIKDAWMNGKTVYVPRCTGKNDMQMVRLEGQEDLDSLPRNKWGIPEPAADRAHVDPLLLDFIVMPGVAFDSKGNRCGHGRGYYDRYLAKATNAFTCAVCLSEQVIKHVPADEHDQKPNIIIAPLGILYES
ncbi:hypothetical protein IWW36_001848 [Coemansia brasiliensis]|uniref:5-formyltetrahydrofolate cyclo-ligase n=1 Tax=Coemansia brasiliensis TaxID=2650707 RepID=A0A9W8IG08_9FUNG|nr:hypothetical protein IWW36_001848 [Coemansia brasiliensis]